MRVNTKKDYLRVSIPQAVSAVATGIENRVDELRGDFHVSIPQAVSAVATLFLGRYCNDSASFPFQYRKR